jgi:hypothetical protein
VDLPAVVARGVSILWWVAKLDLTFQARENLAAAALIYAAVES